MTKAGDVPDDAYYSRRPPPKSERSYHNEYRHDECKSSGAAPG